MAKRGDRSELEHSTAIYEVRCYQCDVSYPVGTRRCMYCGGRPGAQPLFTPKAHPEPLEEFAPLREFRAHPVDSQAPLEADEGELQNPRGALIRVLGNLGWIILFVAITLYRACSG